MRAYYYGPYKLRALLGNRVVNRGVNRELRNDSGAGDLGSAAEIYFNNSNLLLAFLFQPDS
jgi:hypothetical protein